jgi:acetyl-CoA acetyltransferase
MEQYGASPDLFAKVAVMIRRAASQVYEQAGIGIDEVDVVELHDCFTINEVITYEGLGLCGEGEATAFVDAADNTHGGKYVVNPSGGLMSKGHPIGATGLAQCYELVNQLRGNAGARCRERKSPYSTISASAVLPWSPCTGGCNAGQDQGRARVFAFYR